MTWWLMGVVMAQDIAVPNMNVQYFRPSIDAKGTLWVDDVRGGDAGVTPRVLLHYTNSPMNYQYQSGAAVPVVAGMAMADVLMGYRRGPVRLGLDVPLVLSAEGIAASGEFGLGDVGLDGMLAFDSGRYGWGFSARYALPTSTLANPLGNPRGDVEALAIAHVDVFGDWFALVLNGGVGGHPAVEVENLPNWQIRGRFAGTVAVSDNAGGALEVVHRGSLSTENPGLTKPRAGEVLVSAWAKSAATTMRAGIGTGLGGGIGTADLRAMLGVEWGKTPPPPDTDGDGIIDDNDRCRLEAEDVDGVQDDDGCVDPTPMVLIDLMNGSGAPIEGRVHVFSPTEDFGTRPAGARWQLQPGSYSAEVVGSDAGVMPVEVSTVELGQSVRLQVFQPGKVSLKVVDQAGNEVPGARYSHRRAKLGMGSSWSGELPEGEQVVIVRAPGFAPQSLTLAVSSKAAVEKTVSLLPARVQLEGDSIRILERVYFQSGSATIQDVSYALLNEVASVLLENPELSLVRVEGHTDASGDPAANLKLSKDRANAVLDFLVLAGVDLDRLDAMGFGDTKPLVKGTTPEANEQNRRVEFTVVRRGQR